MNNHLSREEKFIDIQAAGRQETKALEKRLLVLEVITAVAPLLGLLGTVLGLEDIFGIISELGLGQAKAFSGGACRSHQNHGIWSLYCNSKPGCV